MGISLDECAGYVRRLAAELAAEADRLPALMAHELGKPIRFGRAELEHSLAMLESTIRQAEEVQADEVYDSGDRQRSYKVRRRPHGIVAVITPWNNPIYIALGKIVPAILYGNAVVWKAAPEARRVSLCLFECFAKAGWPEGLVQILGGGQCEAEALMNDDRIAAVTITGSSATGYNAQEICARRRIPLQAELGGNNAAIVWPDADLESAARLIARGAFEMAGQRCTANRRAIVQESCRAQFMRLIEVETATLQWGDPSESATDIGPMVNAAQRGRVAETVERAIEECGSPILPLGETPSTVAAEHAGNYYPPTILCCDDPDAEIVQEETFGPVLVVQAAQDWDHAVRLCNGVRQGLVASVFTTSGSIIQSFLEQVDGGILKVNQCTAGAAVGAPFGGWKASGIGPPEHGRFDVEFFTRPQTVYDQP